MDDSLRDPEIAVDLLNELRTLRDDALYTPGW